jgi:hypothetical protein
MPSRAILEAMWKMPYREIAQELTNRNNPTPRGVICGTQCR